MYSPSEIVVPVDFSESSLAATQRAMTIAKVFGAPVHLVHSVEDRIAGAYGASSVPRGLFDTLQVQARARLDQFEKEVAQEGVVLTGEIATIDPVSAIQAAVESRSANLIAMGSRGLSAWKHLFLGSVAERTLRTADCPVLVVKEAADAALKPVERVLLATDFSAHSKCASSLTRYLAVALGASVDIVHAFVPPAGSVAPYSVTSHTADLISPLRERAEALLEEVAGEFEGAGIRVHSHLCDGFASERIAREADRLGADLIVMGTRGHTGLKHIFLGSIAERTIRAAHCSVLTTKEGDRL